jgi:hypothetical protein
MGRCGLDYENSSKELDGTKWEPTPASSAGQERKCEDADHEPQGGEDQSEAEESPKIETSDSGDYDIPERRSEVAHLIADTQREKAPFHSYSGGKRGL